MSKRSWKLWRKKGKNGQNLKFQQVNPCREKSNLFFHCGVQSILNPSAKMFADPLVSRTCPTQPSTSRSQLSDWIRISDRTDDNLQWIGSALHIIFVFIPVELLRHTRPFIWQRTANESFLFIMRYSHCVFIIFFCSLFISIRGCTRIRTWATHVR